MIYRTLHIGFRLALFAVVLSLAIPIISCDSGSNETLSGYVKSGDEPVVFATVILYGTGTGGGPRILGQSQTDASGFFRITYDTQSNRKTVLYLIAENSLKNTFGLKQVTASGSVTLAAVLGTPPVPTDIVINERTTIAAAYVMAQFITGDGFDGTYPGLQNAAATAGNLANVENGDVASVLGGFPNGVLTSTLATFNSLANLIASCARTEADCASLFALATTPGGDIPSNTFDAAVNIAHFPWQNVQGLLSLSQDASIYVPALAPDAELQAWTLAIRYDGNGEELDGPGNIIFDEDGNAWICNNYVYHASPFDPDGEVCGGQQVLKFTPTGDDFPGAPYEGGGVYGAGFGITFDPKGDIWVGNFGFQGSNCPYDLVELSQTVSQFAPDGTPISPDSEGNETGKFHGGWQGAGNTIRRPQGTVSDQAGNIWITNCSGDSVTQFPNGDPDAAFEIAPVDDSDEPLLQHPFDTAIDPAGNAWVTSNNNNSIFAFDAGGALISSLTGSAASDAGIVHPMGIAGDALGNIWVANSGIVRPPCGTPTPDTSLFDAVNTSNEPGFSGEDASVTMILPDGTASPGSPYKGGGLLVPWGIAVDGGGNVWVANFAGQRVSQICGASPENCPPGFETGDPISPEGGYSSGALVRNTSVSIDPSGNVWLANNWQTIPVQQNPGGHEVVVFIGLAKPVKAPLIGPPSQP